MPLQDLAVVLWLLLLNGAILWGITGPRHQSTHLLLLGTSLFTPFVAYDLTQAEALPLEAWLIAVAFVGVQGAHTAFHAIKPGVPHSRGPEILFQPIVCIWAATFAQRLEPELWYRGELGRFFFCTELIFVSLAVLVYIYAAEMTAREDDEIDFRAYTLRSRSNALFLAASAVGLGVTLYATFDQPAWLLGAVAGFVAVRLIVPAGPEAVARVASSGEAAP